MTLVIPQSSWSNETNVSLGEGEPEVPNELKLFQNMPLVITAARKPQSITEAPSTIDVITAEDIRRSGALTLAEILERLPGIYTPTAHNALDMLWIRGVGGRYNDNALLLIDGQPYRTLYFSNFPINEQIPLEDIRKIEIIRGPGSALYGTNAFTGVINILTKDVIDMKRNEASLLYGSWNTQKYHLFAGKEFEKGEVNFFARYLDSDGYRIRKDDEGRPSDKRRYTENQAYKLKLKYQNIDFIVRYSKFTLENVTAALDENENGDEHTREHLLTQISYRRALGEGLSLQVRGYFNYFDFNSSGIGQEPDLSISAIGNTENYGRVAGVDIFSTFKFSSTHTLLFGLNYEYEYLDRARTKVAEPPSSGFELTEWASETGDMTPDSIDNSNIGVYVEDELKLAHNIILTSGLRFDSFEASDSSFSPRVSLVYTPDDKTAIKLRYGEAFRAPTYQELYKQNIDNEEEGNVNLSPQTIKTAEFEISRFLAEEHRLNTTFYYSEIRNFIKVVPDGNFQNLGTREFYGIEIGLQGKIFQSLSYFSNYSLSKGKESGGQDIAGVPENMGNIGFSFTGFKYLDVNPHIRFVGRRNGSPFYQQDVFDSEKRDLLGGYVTVNLALIFKNLPGSMEASLAIRNLFDETYHTPGELIEDLDIRQPGRRILFTLSTKF